MTLTQAVTVTYEMTGTKLSDLALATIVDDLSAYPLDDVLMALAGLRKAGKRFALVDILERLPGAFPGVEEAWGIVSQCLSDQEVSLVWTDEMAEAYGQVSHMRGDQTGARMAFKEIYTKLIREARDQGQAPRWKASLGHDPSGRERALVEAVKKKRLSADYALRLVIQGGDAEKILMGIVDTKRLA
jgi:hypothetical protein